MEWRARDDKTRHTDVYSDRDAAPTERHDFRHPTRCDRAYGAGPEWPMIFCSANRLSSQTMTTFAIHGPIARDDLPGLYQRVCATLTHARGDLLICEVSDVDPDAVTVDALARLGLAARKHGCQIRLRGATQELRELVDFMGLADVLPE
jgi:ABC-type transporter Mla MlaB component